ncbi:hypothetical protein CDL12_00334 [Handroanthus impetiginosus]|uniref:Uncharacterized protein n=1 Tax=Handroanthus impetiginosus TaxID=429701 RepID=A0A2G9IAX6_9LAMI|nr:hypothetical protein CDL12_00334 [Handroanthus impetiginosus]
MNQQMVIAKYKRSAIPQADLALTDVNNLTIGESLTSNRVSESCKFNDWDNDKKDCVLLANRQGFPIIILALSLEALEERYILFMRKLQYKNESK